MSTNIVQQSKSSFSCGLVTQRDSRDLTAIIIVLFSDALAFGVMVVITKLLTNSAVKKYKKGIKRNASWIVFTFCERPRIIQHNIVPMSTIHHSHPLGSVSPHYSFGGKTSPEPSLHSAEATLANEIKSTDRSKSIAFNEVEIVDCLHGRASSESDKKEAHSGGFFSISDEAILERRGVDALNYLLFLRHLIFFLAIISVLCIFIILPINLMGNYVRGKSLFSRLTIENVPPGSEYLWTHIAVANLFLPIGIFFLLHNHASARLNKDRFATRTLFIRKTVNKKGALAREDIAALIQEITTNELVIEGIQFVYDVRGMKIFKNDFVLNFNAERFCIDYLDDYDESFELRPYKFGQWLGLLGLGIFFPKSFGLTYYRTKKWEAVRNLLREYTKTMGNAQGAFFITFRTESMARSVYQQINTTTCFLKYCPNNSFCSPPERHEAESWQASFAPDPTDINWDALVINKKGMWLRTFLVNFLLFIIFFFCTTPSFILPYIANFPANTAFSELQKKYEHELKPISFLAQFLKPLVLLLVASILPSVVYYFSSLVPDPLKSEQTHGVMWRVYCFMILMIIIIPSLGQSSFHEVVRSIVSKQTFQWYCIFHSYEYSFFVIYVIQSAFIGNGLELLKISRIFTYFYHLIFKISSEAERDYVINQIDLEFNLGLKYSRSLFMLTMILLYSVSCPLITICGLIFIIIKYFVDRHILYHSAYPSQVSNKTYRKINFMFFSTILMMQFHLFTIVYTKYAPSNALAFDLILLLLSIMFLPCLTYVIQSSRTSEFMRNATGKNAARNKQESNSNWCCCAYLPDIIKQLGKSKIKPKATASKSETTSVDTLS